MILSQPFDHLKARVAEDVAEATKIVAGGGASDYADYKQRIGYIKGLERIQALIAEITEERDKRR